jgi:hypothetical protein
VAASKAILGMQLVTHQTGPQCQKVQQLLIEHSRTNVTCGLRAKGSTDNP